MKIFPAKAIICGLLLVTVSALKGQKIDYVITNDGDTLKGQFTGKKFKADNRVKAQSVDVMDYKETYNAKDNVMRRAVITPGAHQPAFLEVVENGKIDLYKKIAYGISATFVIHGGVTYGATQEVNYYAAKENDSLKELEYREPSFIAKKKRMSVLSEMFKDKTDIYNQFIADDKFGLGQIRSFIHFYNTGRLFRDYVIKENTDTLYCELEPSTFNTMGRYRVNTKDRFIKIDTSITEYFLAKDSSTYILKTLPKKNRREYVKCLAHGRVNLYAYSLNNTAADNEASLYASKDSDYLIQIKNAFSHSEKKEKKGFADLLSDNPALCEKFQNTQYSFTSVLIYVKMYNGDYLAKNKPAK